MTPSDNKPDSQELERTVRLMRCNKHGISFYLGDTCPECEKENALPKPPPSKAG